MSDVKCGIAKLKAGETRGTAQECADKKQVRYYGIVKVDKGVILNKEMEKEKKKLLL